MKSLTLKQQKDLATAHRVLQYLLHEMLPKDGSPRVFPLEGVDKPFTIEVDTNEANEVIIKRGFKTMNDNFKQEPVSEAPVAEEQKKKVEDKPAEDNEDNSAPAM